MSRPTRDTPEGRAYLELRALARATGRTTAELIQLYALERFAARVAASAHRDRLVLKGGLLMAAFGARRPTRDVDLLALGLPSDVGSMSRLIAEVAALDLSDGLQLDPDLVRARPIREASTYAGVRVSLRGRLASARISFHVDVNVGDPVHPPARPTDLPTLLGTEPVSLLAYPVEMVVAEKLVTAVERGGTNTRWRDFVDLTTLLRGGVELRRTADSVRLVAQHRGLVLVPFDQIERELGDRAQSRWAVWRRKEGLQHLVSESLAEVLAELEPMIGRIFELAGQKSGAESHSTGHVP